MPHSFVSIFVHTTFHIARHSPSVPESRIEQLHGYLNGIFRECGVRGSDIGGTETHVHSLFRLPTNILLGDIIGRVKANSSRWLRLQGVRGFWWQQGSAGFSVGASAVPTVRQYIRNQKEHHRRMSYREEVEFLFRRYGIDNGGRFFSDVDEEKPV